MRLDPTDTSTQRWFGGMRKSRYLRIAFPAILFAAAVTTTVGVLISVQLLAWIGAGLVVLALALLPGTWAVGGGAKEEGAPAEGAMQQALNSQSSRLAAFQEIAATVGQSLDLHKVLELGLEKIVQITGQEAAEIHLLDPTEHTMALKASIGGPEGFQMREEVVVVGECLCGLAMLAEGPLVVPDTDSDPRVTRLACRRFGYQSAACVPLRVKGRSIGVLTVHGREKGGFGEENTELLVTVANQLATAIENARLYSEMEARVEALSRKLQYLAIVEERERLGREMHDGLAQTLSLLSIQVGQAKLLARGGDLEGVANELKEISRVVDAGYEEVREAITSLRFTAPKGAKWLEWLQEYVFDFGLRHDLVAQVDIPSGHEHLVLPPHQEVHLTRIVQEALNNVRKHSGATQVHMALVPNGRKLRLLIEDDGRGFDVERARGRDGSFGLSTMQERAQLSGGKLRIKSSPGQGTTIIVEISRDGTGPQERK